MGEKTASRCTVGRFVLAWGIENIEIKENVLCPTQPKQRECSTGAAGLCVQYERGAAAAGDEGLQTLRASP